MARVLAAGYDERSLDKFTRGSENGEPMGVITALDATASREVLLTTAGEFGEIDIYKMWAALPAQMQQDPHSGHVQPVPAGPLGFSLPPGVARPTAPLSQFRER